MAIWCYVPAGAFKMGDNFGDGDPRERPVHMVELDAFYIAKYEMTNGEWRKFRDDPGYDDAKFWPGGWVVPKNQVPYWNDARNHGGGTPNSDEYPVLGVNWDSATAYCNWLSAKTGKKYRLPTEAEWEKAARGTDQRRYPWGNEIDRSLGELRGRAAVRYRASVGILRRHQARRVADAQQRVALRRVRYGGQRDGVVLGLVRARLLLGVAEEESQGSGGRGVPRGARRHLLHGSVRIADLCADGVVAFVSRAPDDGIPRGSRSVRFSPPAGPLWIHTDRKMRLSV